MLSQPLNRVLWQRTDCCETFLLPTAIQKLRFSIIIPTFERPAHLAICLDSIVQLAYPKAEFEVIVVDDGSTLAVNGVTDRYQAALNLTLVCQPNSGPATARNRGARLARGAFVAFTDDDCSVAPDWLTHLDRALTEEPRALVGGTTRNAVVTNRYAEASQALIDFLYTHHRNASGQPSFFTSNNMALSAELFKQLGGFDTAFPLAAGEDRDFADRWHQQHLSLQLVPEALVYHRHQLNLRSYFQQHVNYGRGAYRLHSKSAWRQPRSVGVGFYLRLITFPLWRSAESEQPRIILFILIIIAQAANLLGQIQVHRSAAHQARRPAPHQSNR